MTDRHEFPYQGIPNGPGNAVIRPVLPFALRYNGQRLDVSGLLDSGADVNVLPYQIGLALGCIWEERQTAIQLSGNLANYEARGVILEASVAAFSVVRLAFAWTRAEHIPLILGQVNFFQEFDICFFRSRNMFEITQRETH